MTAASAQFTLSELFILWYLWAACLSSTQRYSKYFIGSALVNQTLCTSSLQRNGKGNRDGILLFLWECLNLCWCNWQENNYQSLKNWITFISPGNRAVLASCLLVASVLMQELVDEVHTKFFHPILQDFISTENQPPHLKQEVTKLSINWNSKGHYCRYKGLVPTQQRTQDVFP